MVSIATIFFVLILLFPGRIFATNNLLYTSLNSLLVAQTPEIGPTGTTNLDVADFAIGRNNNGANFSAATDYLYYPTADIFQTELGYIPEERAIDFWYKPNYNQDDNTRDHFIFSDSSDRFYIKHNNSDHSVRMYIKLSAFTDLALSAKSSVSWQAGDWVRIQAYWYDVYITDPDPATVIIPRLIVNGRVSEGNYNGIHKNLAAATNLFVGNKNNTSSLSADGMVDELYIYDQVWQPNITSISPSNPIQGEIITISGTGFGPSDYSTVTIGGTSATVNSWSDTQIVAVVPSISSGTKSVFASTWGQFNSSSSSITIGQAPAVSGLSASNITKSSATINWTTSRASKTIINWGVAESYGNTLSTSNFVSSHSVNLTGLSPSTRYHFQILVEDQYGSSGSTGDYSFITDREGFIINAPPEEDSVEFIPKASVSSTIEDEDTSEETSFVNMPIFVFDKSGQERELKSSDAVNDFTGDDLDFHGQTDPNTDLCLIFKNDEVIRECTISDNNGYWRIELSGINPGDYKIWIEFPDSNKKGEIYNVRVKGEKTGSTNNQWVYIIVSSILVIILTTYSIYRYKTKKLKLK